MRAFELITKTTSGIICGWNGTCKTTYHPYLFARYVRMAFDSNTITPSSFIAGMVPVGLMAKYLARK